MKIAIYETLDKIPEADRGDYKQVTEAGSPNFNKFVLDLDPQHPVAQKNVELLGEKSTRDAQHQTAIQQKDTEIARVTNELNTAKATTLPAGHVAIPVSEVQVLNEVKALGDIKTVKDKLAEHGTLKANQEQQAIKEKLTEIAERNGMEPSAFVQLATVEKLAPEAFETREIADAKGEKVKHDFVKTKDSTGVEKTLALGDYVKESTTFKPFLGSLYLSDEDKKKVKIPATKVGEKVEEKSAAEAYLGAAYAMPEAK